MIPKDVAIKWQEKTEGRPVLRFLLQMGLELPVVGFWLILFTCWYFYCVPICAIACDSLAQKLSYLVIYNVLVVLSVTSFVRTMYSPSPEFPSPWHLSKELMTLINRLPTDAQKNQVLEQLIRDRHLPVQTRNKEKGVAFCTHCKIIKPDRTHHCKRCKKCRPRYDHHCPWLNKCIHHGNHKFFMLMLIYTLLFGWWQAFTSIEFLVLWGDQTEHEHYKHTHWAWQVRIGAVYLMLLASVFSFAIGQLLIFHMRITIENETTVDQREEDDLVKTLDWTPGQIVNFRYATVRNNIATIFGPKLWQWPLPIHTVTEGPFEYQIYVDGVVYNLDTNSTNTETISNESKVDVVPDGTAKSDSTSTQDTYSTNYSSLNKTQDTQASIETSLSQVHNNELPAQHHSHVIGPNNSEVHPNNAAGKLSEVAHRSYSAEGDTAISNVD